MDDKRPAGDATPESMFEQVWGAPPDERRTRAIPGDDRAAPPVDGVPSAPPSLALDRSPLTDRRLEELDRSVVAMRSELDALRSWVTELRTTMARLESEMGIRGYPR